MEKLKNQKYNLLKYYVRKIKKLGIKTLKLVKPIRVMKEYQDLYFNREKSLYICFPFLFLKPSER